MVASRYKNYILSRNEASKLAELCESLIINDKDAASQEAIIKRIIDSKNQHLNILKNLTYEIKKLIDDQENLGLLFINQLPTVTDPMYLIAVIGSLLGDICKYDGEGDFIISIKNRVSKDVERPSFQNSREFYLHTDLSYVFSPPEFLLLHSISNNPDEGGFSIFCDIENVVKYIDDKNLFELTKSNYIFQAPNHFKGSSEVQFPILEIKDNLWKVRFRRDSLRSKTRDGIDALCNLIKAYQICHFEIPLYQNSIAIVNNRMFLHGRTAFLSDFKNVKPRSLNRLYVNREN